MNCKKARFYFPDYADNTMDRNKRAGIENHLARCAACRLYYETQRRLHESIKSAVASELAGIHFQPVPIGPERSNSIHRLSVRILVWRMGHVMPGLLLLFVVLWPLLRPAPRNIDDPIHSGYAEAFQNLQMYGTDSPNPSRFAAPVAVIIRPGAPARVIELERTTDVSAELK